MPKLNPISGKKLAKILKSLGFEVIRVKGSHHYFHHDDGRSTTVPIHSNEDVATGTMRAILADVKLSVEEYNKLR